MMTIFISGNTRMTFLRVVYALLAALILIPMLPNKSASQDSLVILIYPLENQVDVVVKGAVFQSNGAYKYEYTLISAVSSAQKVWEFSVFNVPHFDSLRNANGWDVGVSTVPAQRVTWAGSDSNYFVFPGTTLSGFSIVSGGLPSVKDYFATGWVEAPVVDVEPDSIEGGLFPENSFHGITVGPNPLPSLLVPLDFLDTLSSLVSQSRSLGWITNQSIADKYASLFARARSDVEQFEPKVATTRLDTVLQQVNVDSSSSITSEAYALIRFNTEYLKAKLQPMSEVSAAIYSLSGTSLSVRARPSINFGASDTVRCLTATIRWPASFNASFGAVSSPDYGFVKVGAVAVVDGYKYQKFQTTGAKALNWQIGQEYELFTVPIAGYCGAEVFELTNALPGGEWFVDINYLDKTDSSFYQPLAYGFAWSNKADNSMATAYNGARHVALHVSKFHETYASGGEIIYRRKDVGSSGWEVTSRISAGNGSNNDPSVIVAHDGSVHVVWQRLLTPSVFALWYRKSSDGGSSWAAPDTIPGAGNVTINQSSQWNIYPVLAEYGTAQLVVVFCSQLGLRYVTSTNLGVSWTSPQTISGTSSPGQIWYPSLAAGSDFLTLTYDTRYSGIFSKRYNGTTWEAEQDVRAGLGTIYDRCSSVALDGSNVPTVAWCAQRSGQSEYRILVRSGNTGGTSWSPYYTEFARTIGVSDYYPSISKLQRGGSTWRMEVLWFNSNSQVMLNTYTYSSWGGAYPLATNAQWVNVSLQELNSNAFPIRVWSEGTGSPYEVKLSSDGSYQLQSLAEGSAVTELHRRVTLESVESGSFVSFELSPLKLVSAAGDTTELPFKPIDESQPLVASVANAWEYLGTEGVNIPSNARYLVFDAEIQSVVREDSVGHRGKNVFPTPSFRIDLQSGLQTVSVLTEQAAKSGHKIIDLTPWAGKTLTIRPVGVAVPKSKETPVLGIGDIYVQRRK